MIFSNFRNEVNRIVASCHKAVELGQEKKAKDLIGELYGLAFDYYKFISEVSGVIEKMIKENEDPITKRTLGEVKQNLDCLTTELYEKLNKFGFDFLNHISTY